uniref:Uncharacterized protein n=1 Tax=Timema monikensis TaxID=170555 RepID=A0A7R9EM90_9NEOP|nr:unnamed protein product [Timema monikensis]
MPKRGHIVSNIATAPRLTQQHRLMVSPALTTTAHALTQALEKSPDSQHMQNLVYALLPSNHGQKRDLGQTAVYPHDSTAATA